MSGLKRDKEILVAEVRGRQEKRKLREELCFTSLLFVWYG